MKFMVKKSFQKVIAGAVLLLMMASLLVQPKAVKADDQKLTGKTAAEIVAMMGPGFNVGNALDATGGSYINGLTQETAWGNPLITQVLFDALAAEGFTCVRIPVTWYRYMSNEDGKYVLREDFLNRVKDVVDYALNAGLFVILNTQHEDFTEGTGLVDDLDEHTKQLCDLWSTLSDTFADYDQHLIFESMNEPRNGEVWTTTQKLSGAVNYMNQVFVNTVRCNGKGYNRERCLMVQGYAAGCNELALKGISLPTYRGEVCNNLIVSTHSYTPYDLCLTDKDAKFDAADMKQIDKVFEDIDTYFLSYGIPVVMGETGITNTKGNTADREAFTEYMGAKSASYGVPVLIWDNGANKTTGGEAHYYLDRKNGVWAPEFEGIVKAFINGYKTTEYGCALTGRRSASGDAAVRFYANGGLVETGMAEPAPPLYKNLVFEGWYTTPDYKEELDLSKVDGTIMAYAKQSLDLEAFGLVDNDQTASEFNPLVIVAIGVGSAVLIAVIVVIIVTGLRRKKSK